MTGFTLSDPEAATAGIAPRGPYGLILAVCVGLILVAVLAP